MQQTTKSCKRKITLTNVFCSYGDQPTEETPYDTGVHFTLFISPYISAHNIRLLQQFASHVDEYVPEAVSVNTRTSIWYGNDDRQTKLIVSHVNKFKQLNFNSVRPQHRLVSSFLINSWDNYQILRVGSGVAEKVINWQGCVT